MRARHSRRVEAFKAFPEPCYELHSLIHPDVTTRDIHAATMDSSSVKQSVMKQVLAEANLANARVLIEV